MRKSLPVVSLLALLVVMTGCRHRKTVVATPPPPAAAPAPQKPVKQHNAVPHITMADIPIIPMPVPPNVVLGGAVEPAPRPHWQPPAHAEKKNSQADKASSPTSSAVAGNEPPKSTPIGQLSAAPNTKGLPGRSSIAREIQSIQKELAGIHHQLSASQQRTASQIRTFLQKATNALQAGDLDGANTLTVKARVLLQELH